jgi:4-oxalocrotonate tautomerase
MIKKALLAADITEVLIRHLNSKDGAVSVALNLVEQSDWQKVWDSEIAPQMEQLIRSRVTACNGVSRTVIAAPVRATCQLAAAGRRRGGLLSRSTVLKGCGCCRPGDAVQGPGDLFSADHHRSSGGTVLPIRTKSPSGCRSSSSPAVKPLLPNHR